MCTKLLFIVVAVFIQSNISSGQRQWVPQSTTAGEMMNPYTWYWPYAKAAAEGYQEYFKNAQKITNELYKQAYATGYPWLQNQGSQAMDQAGQAAGQVGEMAGQGMNQAGQMGGPAGQMAGQAGQGVAQSAGQTGKGGAQTASQFINPNGGRALNWDGY